MNIPHGLLEVGTWVGRCPMNCLKYCPQEVTDRDYKGDRWMTFEMFEQLTVTVPKDVPLSFVGMTEPFLNHETVDMVELTHRRGNPIYIFSTLVGLTPDDIDRLAKCDIDGFILHLPDACGNTTIPPLRVAVYKDTLYAAITKIKNIDTMNMGGLFTTDTTENIPRGTSTIQKKGRLTCRFLKSPQYSLYPNGNLYFCCATRGLTGLVGSLYASTYPDLTARHKEMARNLQYNPDSICRHCSRSMNYYQERIASLPLFGVRDYLMRGVYR